MIWYAAIVCVVVAAVFGLLTQRGIIPYSVGASIGWTGAFAFVVLYWLDTHVTRQRDRSRYRKAGFEIMPRNGRQKHEDFVPFVDLDGRQGHTDCFYCLPEAPQVRIYDFFHVEVGKTLGHVIVVPTSAPAGVAARGWEIEQLRVRIRNSGDLVAEGGVVRSRGEQFDVLARALPSRQGVLVVRWDTARWMTYGAMSTDEIISAMRSLQTLPPPEGADEPAEQNSGGPVAKLH